MSRIGGDEFVVLLLATDGSGAAEALRAALQEGFDLEGQHLSVAVSIGIAVFPEHGRDANSLLRHADELMYVAKHGSAAAHDLNPLAIREIRHADRTAPAG